MCTVIHKKDWQHPKVANEDIIVYKVGSRESSLNFGCVYFSFIYIPGTIYECEMELASDECASDTPELRYMRELSIEDRIFIGKGFHSYESIKRMNEDNGNYFRKGEFIIPKGAKYYQNPVGNIVSNKLMFVKFI